QVALAGVLEIFGHVKIGVHAGFQDGNASELVELGGMRVEIESAGDENIETGVRGFASGLDQIRPGYGSELRTDQDGGAARDRRPVRALRIAAFRADEGTGP